MPPPKFMGESFSNLRRCWGLGGGGVARSGPLLPPLTSGNRIQACRRSRGPPGERAGAPESQCGWGRGAGAEASISGLGAVKKPHPLAYVCMASIFTGPEQKERPETLGHGPPGHTEASDKRRPSWEGPALQLEDGEEAQAPSGPDKPQLTSEAGRRGGRGNWGLRKEQAA